MPQRAPFGGDVYFIDTVTNNPGAPGGALTNRKGELLGVLPKPQDGPLTNVALAGTDLQYLYVSCGTKVFKRKTQAKAVLFYKEPLK